MMAYPDERKQTSSVLPLTPQAVSIHKEILMLLKILEEGSFSSCLDEGFVSTLKEVHRLFDIFQKEVLNNSELKCCCRETCATCCYHWVEDVNSFEAEIIADYIHTIMPGEVKRIIETCRSDCLELERLNDLVQKRLLETGDDGEQIDEIDLLLSVYYQMKRPCPLLDRNNRCSIYAVRPLTCRIYINLSNPSCCDPECINDSGMNTYLLDLEEDANQILDRLHFKYMKFEGDTGLRSLIPRYLENM